MNVFVVINSKECYHEKLVLVSFLLVGIVSLGQSSYLFRSLKMNVIYEKGVYLRRQGCGEDKRCKKCNGLVLKMLQIPKC